MDKKAPNKLTEKGTLKDICFFLWVINMGGFIHALFPNFMVTNSPHLCEVKGVVCGHKEALSKLLQIRT